MDNRRRLGYEYRYRFWKDDDKVITDEIMFRYRTSGVNVFLFEIRTNFILKRTIVHDVHDEDEIVLCSESFDAELEEYNRYEYLEDQTSYRLKEYWMLEDEIVKLVHGAYNFARQHKPSTISSVISFVVGIDVCTVQQEGEELEAAMDRAIRAENLVPWNYIHLNYFDISRDMLHFLFNLPMIRVEDVNEGLGLMETCPICLHSPTISTQITHVPKCNHVFHTHCIAKWLLKNNSCPLCRLQVV